jgi:hypothetical protein
MESKCMMDGLICRDECSQAGGDMAHCRNMCRLVEHKCISESYPGSFGMSPSEARCIAACDKKYPGHHDYHLRKDCRDRCAAPGWMPLQTPFLPLSNANAGSGSGRSTGEDVAVVIVVLVVLALVVGGGYYAYRRRS